MTGRCRRAVRALTAGRLVPRRWLRLPRRSVRLRLAALYAALFLVSGACLLTITYALVAHQLPTQSLAGVRSRGAVEVGGPNVPAAIGVPGSVPASLKVCAGRGTATSGAARSSQDAECYAVVRSGIAAEHHSDLDNLLIGSWVALAVMTIAALGLGWLMAGRALRPLRTITSTARNISASNLHQRLALTGPDDELKELGDTFDRLLARLEAAFEAQRQFVANASHELRTPLARQRTLVEVALGDPEPTTDALRAVCERVLVAGEQQERLIEALLTLARSQRGLDRWDPVDLAAVTADAVEAREREAAGQHLQVSLAGCGGGDSGPAWLMGDARLAERLVANLVDNAVRHNVRGGRITVRVGVEYGQAVLAVANTGPVVPPGEVGRLFAPFQRLGASRHATGSYGARGQADGNGDHSASGYAARRDGQGLGLSIVSAIAAAHGADLHAQALAGGGLDVRVKFRAPPVSSWAPAEQPAGSAPALATAGRS
jgi:signal transduction histidine kinase